MPAVSWVTYFQRISVISRIISMIFSLHQTGLPPQPFILILISQRGLFPLSQQCLVAIRYDISCRKYVLSFLKWAFSGNTSSFAAVGYRVSFLRLVQANQFMDLSQYNDSRRKARLSEEYKHSSIIQSKQL